MDLKVAGDRNKAIDAAVSQIERQFGKGSIRSSGGFRYVLLETASGTGDQLLRFSSKDRELVYTALAHELGARPGSE